MDLSNFELIFFYGVYVGIFCLIMTRQNLTAFALSQALPSCQEKRGGQFGKIMN